MDSHHKMSDKNFNFKILILLAISVIGIVFLIWTFFFNNLHVQLTSPIDGATNTAIDKPITVSFKKSLNPIQTKSLKIVVYPNFAYGASLSKDNKTLFINPNYQLESTTKYTIKLTAGLGSYSWSFTTGAEPDSNILNQGESDSYFSSQEKKFNANFPWYDKFPHRTDDYFVGFDPQQNEFYADLYIVSRSEDEIKSEVLEYLKSVGVNTNNYNVSWTTHKSRPTTLEP